MSSFNLTDPDRLQQEFGARDERIRSLEQQVLRQQKQWETGAREWHRFQRHLSDLGEWLIDAATNEAGRVMTPQIDAALGGETCVPCSFTMTAHGKQYQIDLVSTCYEVKEI